MTTPFSVLPRLMLGLCLLCGAAAPTMADATLGVERAVWRDDSGQADWAAARAATYAPMGRMLAGGYTPAAHNAPRFVWVRVASTSTQLVHAEVLSVAEAADKERGHDLTVGMYLGLLIMFGLWALAQLTLSFNRLVVAAAIWFHSEVMGEFEPPEWLMVLFYAGLAMLPAGLLLIAFGQARLALSFNTTLAAVLPLILFAAVFTAKAFADPTKRAALPATRMQMLLIYGLISVSILVAVTPALGAMGGSEAQLHGFLMHGLFTSAIMLLFLMSRARRQERVQREALARLEEIEREIELANVRREQQGQFMNMLVHELKTPLLVVKMVLGSGRRTPSLVQSAESAIQSMSGVIERCK